MIVWHGFQNWFFSFLIKKSSHYKEGMYIYFKEGIFYELKG